MKSLLQFINFRAIFKRLRTYSYRTHIRTRITYIKGRSICIKCLTSSNRDNIYFFPAVKALKHTDCYSHLRNTRRHRESCPSFSIVGGYEINFSTWNRLLNLTQYCIDCHLSTSIHRIILLGSSIGVDTGTLTSIVFSCRFLLHTLKPIKYPTITLIRATASICIFMFTSIQPTFLHH